MEQKKIVNQIELMDYFNIAKDSLLAMEKEGLPFKRIGTRAKEYDIELVKEWLQIMREEIHSMVIGQEYDNKEISRVYKCGNMGGMRRSKKTNTLVLFSDHTKGIYDDRWDKDILYYTGMGQEGDQVLEGNQNKTLYESRENGVDVYLFEAFESGKHIFMERVELVNQAFQEIQEDTQGMDRNVWVFPIQLSNKHVVISESVIENRQEGEKKKARELSYNKLKDRATKVVSHGNNKRFTKTTTYQRNEYVAELAKRRAQGICELCEQHAPFQDKKGNPYLEAHHVKWLSEGGEDSIYNTIGVCANCHRKLHVVNLHEDVAKLEKKLAQYK
ncbi:MULTISPECIES: HNH endonuclease [Bacillus cereus group]|nr:HNH endonuclease [Bacillus cereus group sp. N8]